MIESLDKTLKSSITNTKSKKIIQNIITIEESKHFEKFKRANKAIKNRKTDHSIKVDNDSIDSIRELVKPEQRKVAKDRKTFYVASSSLPPIVQPMRHFAEQ